MEGAEEGWDLGFHRRSRLGRGGRCAWGPPSLGLRPSSATQLTELAKLVESGKLRPVVETVLPLSKRVMPTSSARQATHAARSSSVLYRIGNLRKGLRSIGKRMIRLTSTDSTHPSICDYLFSIGGYDNAQDYPPMPRRRRQRR